MNTNLQETVSELFRYVKEAWQEIKDICNQVIEARKEIEQQNELRKTWYVPKDIYMRDQVLDKRPSVSRVRNQI